MKHHPLTLSRKLAFILFSIVLNLGIINSHATSVDSTSTPWLPSAQIKQRYLAAEPVATPSIQSNRWGAFGYGRSGDILCPNIISNNGVITANIMTGMREVYASTAAPARSPNNREAFVIGNFRYDPYCNSASSFTGQCTGYRYARTYIRLDEIQITCGTNNKLRYYQFDMNNPSSKSINIPYIGGNTDIF